MNYGLLQPFTRNKQPLDCRERGDKNLIIEVFNSSKKTVQRSESKRARTQSKK